MDLVYCFFASMWFFVIISALTCRDFRSLSAPQFMKLVLWPWFYFGRHMVHHIIDACVFSWDSFYYDFVNHIKYKGKK